MVDFLRTTARLTAGAGSPTYLLGMNWTPGTAGGSNTDATDCLARFRAMWFAMTSIIAPTAVIAFDTTCLVYDPLNGDITGVFSGSNPTNVAGSGSGDLLPAQNQGLIRWNTSQIANNRRVRGRTFVPLPLESFNSAGGAPTGAYTSGLTAGITALMTAGSTASVPVVWHRPTPLQGGFTGQILSGQAVASWAVLRGRR